MGLKGGFPEGEAVCSMLCRSTLGRMEGSMRCLKAVIDPEDGH